MSIKAMSHVWANSKQKGAALLMLLAIADMADENGDCYPGIEYLAKMARVDVRSVQRTVKQLEKAKELLVFRNMGFDTGHGKTNLYRLVFSTIEAALAIPIPVWESKKKRGGKNATSRGGKNVTPDDKGVVEMSPLGVVKTPPDPLKDPLDHEKENPSVDPTPAVASTDVHDSAAVLETFKAGGDPFAYMNAWSKVEEHALWKAFRQHHPTGEKLSARNAADLWQDITLLEEIGTTGDEVQQVIAWRVTSKRRTPYLFKYLLQDVKDMRDRTVPPTLDPALETAICKVFRMQPGDFVTRIGQFLSGLDGDLQTWNQHKLKQPMSALELAAFKGWYDADERFDNQETPPKTPSNLRDRIDEFRGSLAHDGYVDRAETRLNQWLGIKPPPAPASEEPAPDPEFAAQFEADMAALANMFDARRS